MKNRHISLQFTNVISEINREALLGWFAIDILSDSGNTDNTIVAQAMFKIHLSRLNGSGNSKWIGILNDGTIVNIGEYK